MSMNRRNILTILGFASAASPAIASCDVTRTTFDDGPGPGYRIQKYDPERMASALERLAAEIRNCTVHVPRFHVGSEAVGDGWLTQTLTIDVEVQHDRKALETGSHLSHRSQAQLPSKKDFAT
jgi:hypothetical protein